MIPKVTDCYFYSRENNIIYANLIHGEKVPLIRLHQKFINLIILGGKGFEYMQLYLSMFPHLWDEVVQEPKAQQQQKQLTLF